MAARLAPPPRTPSPKIRIHRSQSFDSPSSRISVTPIDESPYSKSTGSIAKILPYYNALQTAEQRMVLGRNRVMLHTNISEDSLSSDSASSTASAANSPTQGSEDESQFRLFASGSPPPPSSSPSPQIEPIRPYIRDRHSTRNASTARTMGTLSYHQRPALSPLLAMYQDTSVPMYDPWLVRVVLDLFDIRRFEWTVIADMVEKIWGFRTCSADVLGILSGNGRVGRQWWD